MGLSLSRYAFGSLLVAVGVSKKGVVRIEQYDRNLAMRESLAGWMNQFDWQIWFTGTFKLEFSYRDTIKTKRAFGRFIGDLRNNFQGVK